MGSLTRTAGLLPEPAHPDYVIKVIDVAEVTAGEALHMVRRLHRNRVAPSQFVEVGPALTAVGRHSGGGRWRSDASVQPDTAP